MQELTIKVPRIKSDSLLFEYELDSGVVIEYELIFGSEIINTDDAHTQHLINLLAVGTAPYAWDWGYYDKVHIDFPLTEKAKEFFEKAFLYGLAEYRYTQEFDIHRATQIECEIAEPAMFKSQYSSNHALCFNGGGKDGATAVEIVKQLGLKTTLFTENMQTTRQQMQELISADENLEARRTVSSRNGEPKVHVGHQPFNLHLGLLGALIAHSKNIHYIVIANEYSSNFPNIVVDGFPVNHQYTKSFEFESDLQDLLNESSSPYYFSILRPLYETQILKMFTGLEKYHESFSSCNEVNNVGGWCLKCAKCAYIILALTALDPVVVERIFGDRRILEKKEIFAQVMELVTDGLKPLDCVGTYEESLLAVCMMRDSGFINELSARNKEMLLTEIKEFDCVEQKAEIMDRLDREHAIPAGLSKKVHTLFEKHLS